MVLQETDSCAAWQHRSRKYLMRCQSAKGKDSRSEWDTVIDVLEQHCPKPCNTRDNFRHNSSFAEFDFVTPNAHISSMRASLSLIADNEAVIRMVIERPDPWHETRFQNPKSLSWLIVRSHQPWESHSRHIREHRPTDCWCVNLVFFIARALDAIDTPSWFHDTSNALLQPSCGIFILSRREHVEAGKWNARWANISKIKANTWTLSDEKKRSDHKRRKRTVTKAPCRKNSESREPTRYRKQRNLGIQRKRITKFSMKTTNRHCIVTMRWWHRIWLLDGRRVIRAETRLRKKRWEMCSDFYIKKASLEPLTLMIHWSSQKNAKPYRGIMKSLNHTDPTQMESPKEQPEELKKGLRLFLVRSRLDEQRWCEVMECYLASRKLTFMKRWKEKNSFRKKIRHIIPCAHGTLWIRDILSSIFH